jgi:hypothetical protein
MLVFWKQLKDRTNANERQQPHVVLFSRLVLEACCPSFVLMRLLSLPHYRQKHANLRDEGALHALQMGPKWRAGYQTTTYLLNKGFVYRRGLPWAGKKNSLHHQNGSTTRIARGQAERVSPAGLISLRKLSDNVVLNAACEEQVRETVRTSHAPMLEKQNLARFCHVLVPPNQLLAR